MAAQHITKGHKLLNYNKLQPDFLGALFAAA
jgi:hypothetical protein